jgi:hypothetical protein
MIVAWQLGRTSAADAIYDKLEQEPSERQPLLASGSTVLHLDSSGRDNEPRILSIKNGRIIEEQTLCTRA